jgi:hypothetical protein
MMYEIILKDLAQPHSNDVTNCALTLFHFLRSLMNARSNAEITRVIQIANRQIDCVDDYRRILKSITRPAHERRTCMA